MVSFFVVLEHPCPGDFTHLIEIPEQPSAQYFASVGTIEALDKRVGKPKISGPVKLLGFSVVD